MAAILHSQTQVQSETLLPELLAERLPLFNIALQPTTLCNLDCTYCYLPLRKQRRLMRPEVTERVARAIVEMQTRVRLIWHAGEPLACGIRHFRQLLQPFTTAECAPLVTHSVQTNATLIDDEWCALFKQHDFDVGVSIDGPPHFSQRRVNWSGGPTFDAVYRGIDFLRENGIEFTILAVVGRESISRASELYAFAATLSCSVLGINIEETEGPYHAEELEPALVQTFWRELYTAWRANPKIQVREFSRVLHLMREVVASSHSDMDLRRRELLPSVAVNGDVVVLSPELLDTDAQFVVGNVLQEPFETIIRGAPAASYVGEYLAGVDMCERECGYFRVCGGGAASNRYFETGRMDVTETAYCRNRSQYLVDALLGIFKEDQ